MRPTPSSKRDRHELRLIKKHGRERPRKRSTTPTISSASASPPPTKHRRGIEEEDDDDDCDLIWSKTSSSKKRRHRDEQDDKKLKKKKKHKKRSELITGREESHEPESVEDLASALVAEEESGKKVHARGKGQAWSAEEDIMMVRMLLETGERTANWVHILNAINLGRNNVRSMASVKGHWSNVLRSRAMAGKVHRKRSITKEEDNDHDDESGEEMDVSRSLPASPKKKGKSSSKKHKTTRRSEAESESEPEPEVSSPMGSDM